MMNPGHLKSMNRRNYHKSVEGRNRAAEEEIESCDLEGKN